MSSRLRDRQLLGVAQTATKKEIRRRYIELAKKYHPDVAKADRSADGPDIREITAAYQRLIGKERYMASNVAAARYDERPPEARKGATYEEQRQYTRWTLLGGFSLVSAIVAYTQYQPQEDAIVVLNESKSSWQSHQSGNGLSYREWRKG